MSFVPHLSMIWHCYFLEHTGLPEDLMYLVDVGHLESVAAGMEVLLDGVQGALQDSALLWGQAALTLLRDVLKK